MKKDSLWANIFADKTKDRNEVIKTLKLVPLFSQLNTSELKEFEKISHQRFFKAGEPVFWEGEPGVGMYIVKLGSVAVCKITPEKGKEELAILRQGDFFGELALIDEGPRSATCMAHENAEIIGIFRPDLVKLLARKPRLGNKFLFRFATLLGKRLIATHKENKELRLQLEKSNIII
ncbi:MAG: cyclic nucleotide-binding domain-containing protein [Calditrichaeota bacterium]|nr:MAG: cyclic nucleotide-binding domain-containing protein [Calditrichota bacterium]